MNQTRTQGRGGTNALPILITRIAICIFAVSQTMLAPLITRIGADFDLFVIDDETFSDYKTNQSIPVIIQDGARMGLVAANELFRRATSDAPPQDVLIPFRFEFR